MQYFKKINKYIVWKQGWEWNKGLGIKKLYNKKTLFMHAHFDYKWNDIAQTDTHTHTHTHSHTHTHTHTHI